MAACRFSLFLFIFLPFLTAPRVAAQDVTIDDIGKQVTEIADEIHSDPKEMYSETMSLAANIFIFGFDLGFDVLPVPGDESGATEIYQRIGVSPDLNYGKFAVGLNLALRVKIKFEGGDALKVYLPDWVPNYMGNGRSFFEVYFPKLNYIRYGRPGDPFYAKLGSIEDMTLGNGFVMGDYSNTCFLPENRIIGATMGFDKFPYIGLETVSGDLAAFDVSGARIYTWPISFLSLPAVRNLEIGLQAAWDRDPYRYKGEGRLKNAFVWGIDMKLPIIQGERFPLVAIADIAFQEGDRIGGMAGLSGKLAQRIDYNAQFRYLSSGFLPTYFDSSYDLYRSDRLTASANPWDGNMHPAWYVKTGISFFQKMLGFGISAEGPFTIAPDELSVNQGDYLHLKSSISIGNGGFAGLKLSGTFERFFVGTTGNALKEFISPENTFLQSNLECKIGIAVVSLLYKLRFDIDRKADMKTTLQSRIRF